MAVLNWFSGTAKHILLGYYNIQLYFKNMKGNVSCISPLDLEIEIKELCVVIVLHGWDHLQLKLNVDE